VSDTAAQPGPPFAEAIAALRRKADLPTARWTDLWQDQHAVAFTVAGATSANLLAELRAAVDEGLANGGTLAEFRQRFDDIVARHGWQYRGKRGWRTRVIFETNLRTSYAAGRWQQIQESKAARPWLMYEAVLDRRTRPLHRLWDGTVLPVGDPWWRTHYPPNGWGCRCSVISLSEREAQRRGLRPTGPPVVRLIPRQVPGRGVVEVPEGIDPGWGYNPGMAAADAAGAPSAAQRETLQLTEAARRAAEAVAAMPADLGAAVAAAIGSVVRDALAAGFRAWVAERAQPGRTDGTMHALGGLAPEVIAALAARDMAPASAAVAINAAQLRHVLRDVKQQAGTGLALADVMRLPEIVAAPDAVLLERETGVVLLVFRPADPAEQRRGKLVVRLDFVRRVRDAEGRRRPVVYNALTSGGLVPEAALRDGNKYELLTGSL